MVTKSMNQVRQELNPEAEAIVEKKSRAPPKHFFPSPLDGCSNTLVDTSDVVSDTTTLVMSNSDAAKKLFTRRRILHLSEPEMEERNDEETIECPAGSKPPEAHTHTGKDVCPLCGLALDNKDYTKDKPEPGDIDIILNRSQDSLCRASLNASFVKKKEVTWNPKVFDTSWLDAADPFSDPVATPRDYSSDRESCSALSSLQMSLENLFGCTWTTQPFTEESGRKQDDTVASTLELPAYCQNCKAFIVSNLDDEMDQRLSNLSNWLTSNISHQDGERFETEDLSSNHALKKGKFLLHDVDEVAIETTDVDDVRTRSTGGLQVNVNQKQDSQAQHMAVHHSSAFQKVVGRKQKRNKKKRNEPLNRVEEGESEMEQSTQFLETTKAIATKVIAKRLKEDYGLTQIQCLSCSMPMVMKDGETLCVVCPQLSKQVQRISEKKIKSPTLDATKVRDGFLVDDTSEQLPPEAPKLQPEAPRESVVTRHYSDSVKQEDIHKKRESPRPDTSVHDWELSQRFEGASCESVNSSNHEVERDTVVEDQEELLPLCTAVPSNEIDTVGEDKEELLPLRIAVPSYEIEILEHNETHSDAILSNGPELMSKIKCTSCKRLLYRDDLLEDDLCENTDCSLFMIPANAIGLFTKETNNDGTTLVPSGTWVASISSKEALSLDFTQQLHNESVFPNSTPQSRTDIERHLEDLKAPVVTTKQASWENHWEEPTSSSLPPSELSKSLSSGASSHRSF